MAQPIKHAAEWKLYGRLSSWSRDRLLDTKRSTTKTITDVKVRQVWFLSLPLPLPLADDRQTPEQEKSAQLQSLCGLTGLQVGETRPVGLNEQRLFNLTYFVSLPFVQTHNRHRYSVSSLRFHCELPTQCHCITFLPHYFLLQPSKMYSGTCFPRRMCETLLTKTLKETKNNNWQTSKPQKDHFWGRGRFKRKHGGGCASSSKLEGRKGLFVSFYLFIFLSQPSDIFFTNSFCQSSPHFGKSKTTLRVQNHQSCSTLRPLNWKK